MTTYTVRLTSPDSQYYERVMTIDGSAIRPSGDAVAVARWVRDRVALQEPDLRINVSVWPAGADDDALAAEESTTPESMGDSAVAVPWSLVSDLIEWLKLFCGDSAYAPDGAPMRIHHGVAARLLDDLVEARRREAYRAYREAREAQEAAAREED
jgi:hypothetical protein